MQSSLFTKLAFAAMLILIAGQVPNLINATPPATANPAMAGTAFGEPAIAEIRIFGGNFAPRGWAKCEGQLLPISQYNALFSLLGTTYGGDGRTTFGLPDLRGRVAVGTGNGPGLSDVSWGEKQGVEFYTLTQREMPSHSHSATVTLNAGNVDAEVKANASDRILMSSGRGGTPIYTDQPATATLRQDAASVQVDNAGQQQPFDNKQPYLGVTYIIALEGVYPSRQ